MSLGGVQLISQGAPVQLTEDQRRRVEADFETGIREAGVVREVAPSGTRTDLVYYMSSREVSEFPSSVKIGVYQAFLSIPALILPIPFPYQRGFQDRAILKTRVNGTDQPVRHYGIDYVATVWGLSVWAIFLHEEEVLHKQVEYVVPAMGQKILADYPLYENIERAIQSKDEKTIQKLSHQ